MSMVLKVAFSVNNIIFYSTHQILQFIECPDLCKFHRLLHHLATLHITIMKKSCLLANACKPIAKSTTGQLQSCQAVIPVLRILEHITVVSVHLII